MTRLRQPNNGIFSGILPHTIKIKKQLPTRAIINLPFLGERKELTRGTVNLFCGYRGRGFGYFANTLAKEVTQGQNINTLLISDIILKAYMIDNLAKLDFKKRDAQFIIEEDFNITHSPSFVKTLEAHLVKNQVSLLMVYPFLMPEEHCEPIIKALQFLAAKHDLAVVMNIPVEDYMRDQKTLLGHTCEKTFLKTLAVDKVFRLRRPIRQGLLSADGAFNLETYILKTDSLLRTFLKLDEQKQMLYRPEKIEVENNIKSCSIL